MAGVSRWVFPESKVLNTPSRKCGIDADKELSYRQQAANFIQDMGQRLQLRLLATNTAIVYMHRFYMFHSFTKFQRNAVSAACVFLAAKVEEAPRKLEHVLRVYHHLLHRDAPQLDIKSNEYLEKAQELVINENILLQTLGFDVMINHPHSHIVKICDLVRASKDLTQTSYILATNSLHLTMMCTRYRPTLVACVCIHLACKWASYEIPKSSEGKAWWSYVDKDVTEDQLKEISQEFINILDKFPNRLKRAIQIARGEKPPPEPPHKQSKSTPSATATKQTSERGKSSSPAPTSDVTRRQHHHTPTNHDRKQDLKASHQSTSGSKNVSPHRSKSSQKSVEGPNVAVPSKQSSTPNTQPSRSAPVIHADPSRHKLQPPSAQMEKGGAPGGIKTEVTSFKEYKERKDREKIVQKQTSDFRSKLDEYKARSGSSDPSRHKADPSEMTRHKPDAHKHVAEKHGAKQLPFQRYKDQKHSDQHKSDSHVNQASSSSISSSGKVRGHSTSAVNPHPQQGDTAHRQLEMSVHNQEHFNRIKKEHSGHERHSGQHHSRPSDEKSASSQHSQKRTHSPGSSSSRRQSSSSSLPHSSSKKARLDSSGHSSSNAHGSSGKKSHNGNNRKSQHGRPEQGGTATAAAHSGNSDLSDELNELNKKLKHFIEMQGRQMSSHSSSSSPEGNFHPPLPSNPPLPNAPPPPPPRDMPPLPPPQ